ncbi:4-hydroxy-tetrahydrodipicolinate reductase [Haloferacaceae archaeon DSL9]
MTVRLALTGAAGRMGREVIAAAGERDEIDVVLAVNRSPTDSIDGVAVEPASDLDSLLAEREPNVLVDFTGPDSALEYVDACATASVPVVTGTTGFDDAETDALRDASDAIPILWATNFSRGVAALRRAVREAVATLPDADIELTETHHNAKRDAPSGTAKTLLDDVESVREDLATRTHGRAGEQPRTADEIGVHARRAGDISGEHEVLLAGGDEVLSLTHRAGSRRIFAAGALDAAEWLAGRDAGWYDFDAVLDGGQSAP